LRLLKGLFFTALLLVTVLLVIGLFLPQTARVERSITIAASPDAVFELVDGFGRFNEWSPWAGLDPQTRYTYSGPETGVGARMEWASDNPDVGKGSQEVVAVETDASVTNQLDLGMGKPSMATIRLVPEGTGTRVTWTLDSDFSDSIVGRYFGLMLDRMVGPDYEKGLAQLKAIAEATAAAPVPPPEAQPADAGSPTGQDTPVPPSPQ
jgi:uncharacterized protein YndB with AHSA1/START domain